MIQQMWFSNCNDVFQLSLMFQKPRDLWHPPDADDIHRFRTDCAAHVGFRKNSERRCPLVSSSSCIDLECYRNDKSHRSTDFHRSGAVGWTGVDPAANVVR